MNPIAPTLAALRLGTPQAHANLALFPLFTTHLEAPDYLTLDEALAGATGRISEISEGGSVPELAFDNQGGKRVLLVDGEELIGARQNRVLNISILAPAHKVTHIPVSCCEQGRWGYTGAREFSSSRSSLFSSARAAKMMGVSRSMLRGGGRHGDQGEIWDQIAMKSASLGTMSSTDAMADIYTQKSGRIEAYVKAFQALQGQCGAVVAQDGKVAGLELFDAPSTFARFLEKLLRSFALDAIDVTEPVTDTPAAEAAQAFLERLAHSSAQTFASLGEGEDVRMQDEALAAGALVADGRVRHLAAFATTGMEARSESLRMRRMRARSGRPH